MSVNDLPNELLCEIAKCADDADIPNVRLACKLFRDATLKRFASVYFRDRMYELSPSGMKSLDRITENPTFAPYIKNIVLAQGGRNGPAKYHGLADKAVRTLTALGNEVSIGVRRIHTDRNYEDSEEIAYRKIFRLLRKRIMAASETNTPIGNIIVDLVDVPAGQFRTSPVVYWDTYFYNLREWQRLLHDGLIKGLTVRFRKGKGKGQSYGYISYTHSNGRLEGRRFVYRQVSHLSQDFWSSLQEICLQECLVDRSWLLALFAAHRTTLKRLTLYNVHLRGTSRWRDFFQSIDPRLQLDYCHIGKLWRHDATLWLEGGSQTIEVNGRNEVLAVISDLAAKS